MNTTQFNVLLADDSELDRFLLRRAIINSAPRLAIVGEFNDGEEVISYLMGEGLYADRKRFPLPDLLVLDSRMPRKGSIEVLEWLRTQDFSRLKVAVLADSSAIRLRPRAMELGANFFYSKGVLSDELEDIARALQAGLEHITGTKVLLRHRRTRCYYQKMCEWSPVYQHAMEFASFDRAVQYACENQLEEEVEVVLVSSDTGQSFSFPFPSCQKPKEP